jgi:hypothetical protein
MSPTQRNISLTAIIAYVLISGIWIFNANDRKNEAEKSLVKYQTRDGMQMDSLLESNDFLQKIVDADNHFFEGNIDNAFFKYEELMQNPKNEVYSDHFNHRISQIDDIKKDTSKSALNTYRKKVNDLITELSYLENQMDSLKKNKTEKSLSAKEKIAALEKELAEKDKKLRQKSESELLTFRNVKGNLVHYIGSIREGKANGNGTGIWETGGIYKGEWKNNLRHGNGAYTWKDGHRYEGSFLDDIREGYGVYFWASGEKYEGQWKNNQRHGEGTLYDKDHNIQFKGMWENDKIK